VAEDQLVKHPAINKISFTGSTEVGIGIIRNSADTLKNHSGIGKSANIVFADADLEVRSRMLSSAFSTTKVRFAQQGHDC